MKEWGYLNITVRPHHCPPKADPPLAETLEIGNSYELYALHGIANRGNEQ